jgi:hypothetical protein
LPFPKANALGHEANAFQALKGRDLIAPLQGLGNEGGDRNLGLHPRLSRFAPLGRAKDEGRKAEDVHGRWLPQPRRG